VPGRTYANGDALGEVVARAQHRVGLALQLDARVQRPVDPSVQDLLGRSQRDRRVPEQHGDDFLDLFLEILRVSAAVRDQTPVQGLLGGDPLPGEDVVLGAGEPDQPGEALAATAAGDHAEPHLRQREP
jgi:hypothetical protein